MVISRAARTHVASDHDDLERLHLFGESPAWTSTLSLVRRIARNQANTLIEGETGTGKELVARAIHYLSARRDFPFIPLNCGALPDTLLEAELFGHEKGAFTDARERRPGLVAEARGGTFFLDEIEAMTPRAQVVLLRFLQDQTYLPVGGRTVLTGDVRIVAASNADLAERVELGLFRRDLLFRIGLLSVKLPPLREREGDVRILSNKFLERFAKVHGRPNRRLSGASLKSLEGHSWPGNVRELEGLILRELLLQEDHDEELTVLAPASNRVSSAPSGSKLLMEFKRAKAHAVAEFEKAYMSHLLLCARGNMSLAARMSQKDRSALNRLVKKYGLCTADFRVEVTDRSRRAEGS